MKKSFKIKIIISFLTPGILILKTILKNYPYVIENYYSKGINKFLIKILSKVTGVFPFSLAEFLVGILSITLIILIIKLLRNFNKKELPNSILNITSYLSLLYFLFMVMWGFNYYRLPLSNIINLPVEKSSKEDLYNLCLSLVERANALREELDEDSNGVMKLQLSSKEVFKEGKISYENLSENIKELDGEYGLAKGIILSKPMTYTGITGIYMPYTGEANVNVNITDMMLPSTVLHEMAHQRGFAREDEANYIAYVGGVNHPRKEFQYSGIMLGLIHSVNALGDKDMEAYKNIKSKYSQKVGRDLNYQSEFWSKYEGSVEEYASKVNSNYLKSNGQGDGVESYGRMVDLLMAEYKKKLKGDYYGG